jgi:hypothetical protein
MIKAIDSINAEATKMMTPWRTFAISLAYSPSEEEQFVSAKFQDRTSLLKYIPINLLKNHCVAGGTIASNKVKIASWLRFP